MTDTIKDNPVSQPTDPRTVLSAELEKTGVFDWKREHDLAVMRQSLARLDEAADIIASVENALGDMPPIPIPIGGPHLDQAVGVTLTNIIQLSEFLKAKINAR